MTSESEKPWRVFCAVELPAGVRARVAEHAARLREASRGVRVSWERPEKFHLTLKFLAEVVPARVEELSRAAARAVVPVEPFDLTVAGGGSFPPNGPPRVLWHEVRDESGRLALLQKSLEDECAAAGFPRETRPFRPHLTIARPRDPRSARPLAAAHRESPFGPHTFEVSELVVVRSELGPGGSRYTTVSRHAL